MDIAFFRTPGQLRKWFARHGETRTELWVGYYRKDSGTPSVTWSESVDEALCVGWIDGVRKSIDERCYTIRFTRRRQRSVWSSINIQKALALIEAGRMQPAGLEAFRARRENRSGIYSYEQRRPELEAPYASILATHPAAKAFFESQPPSYRKTVSWYVASPKREETRLKRLTRMIELWKRGETGREHPRPGGKRKL